MKLIKFFLILTCAFFCSHNAFADNNIQLIRTLNKYDKEHITSRADFLRTFCGDTIVFNITGADHLPFVYQETPDTLWIKKRPKKNPVEGKHYRLIYNYKARAYGNDYSTPITEINNKQFGVLSVDRISEGVTYYYTQEFTLLKLIDLNDLSVITLKIPETIPCDIPFTSVKCNRIINTVVGTTLYVRTSSYSYTPNYQLATLNSCTADFRLVNNSVYTAKSDVTFNFVAENGVEIPFAFDTSSARDPQLITAAEYTLNYTPKSINSQIDTAIVNHPVELPFSFYVILGTAKSMSTITQTIDPTASPYSYSSKKYLSQRRMVMIGGKMTIKDKVYFKAIYRGKAFFIDSESVILTQDMKLKTDSLDMMNDQQSNYFFQLSLAFSKAEELKALTETFEELNSFTKYGLAIQRWGTYDESAYTDGTSVSFRFYNPTKKVIKYITINYVGYNSVDDPVTSRGRTVMTSKCIGPIAPDEFATYVFEYVWFTDVVDYAKIRSIVVQYKDGTSKTITNAGKITFSDNLNAWLSDSNEVEDLY